MNRLDRFRFGNIHKRKILRTLAVTCCVFAASLAVLAGLGIFSSRSELVRIKLSSSDNGRNLDGAGINITSVPAVNRVQDPCFVLSDAYSSFTIVDATEDFIFFDTDEGLTSEDIPVGSSVRVLALDEDGVMSLRYSGLVSGFEESRFGLLNEVEDSEGNWLNDHITDTVSLDNVVVALTESGKLIADITAGPLVKPFEDDTAVFADICASSDVVYAVTFDGRVYSSNDGRNFDLMATSDNSAEASRIACVNGSVLVVYSDGGLKVFNSGSGYDLAPSFDTNGLRIISNDDRLIAVTSDNMFYETSNGYIFSQIDTEGVLDEESVIIDADCCEDKFCFLTENGRIVIVESSDDGETEIRDLDISSIDPVDLVLSSEGRIIVVTSDRKACLISDANGRVSDLTSNAGNVDAVFKGASDKIFTATGSNLYMVKVLSGIQVNTSVPADSILAGDTCVIDYSVAGDSSWEVIGEGTALTSYTNPSVSGPSATSGRLTGAGQGVHAISQVLYGNSTDNFSDDTFYRMSFTVRCDGSVYNVKMWLSGERFGDVGLSADDVSGKMQEYSSVFAVTGNMLADETVRLNISFEGDGTLYIDNVYVGEDRYDIDSIPDEYREGIEAGHPSTVRLANIPLCTSDFSSEAYYGTGPDSLETGMQLVKGAESLPWFVIGSYADQDSIDSWLGYLCGSVRSDYGKIRIDNGTALPWSRQYDTIYIEISDIDGIFETDLQRGAYVSHVMSLIASSEYYSEVKDKIVFLDGMLYEGGTVISNADYHTMDMTIDLTYNTTGYGDLINGSFDTIGYDAPRFPSRGAESGEFIRSLNIAGDPSRVTAAQIASIAVNDSVRMVMIDVNVSRRPVDTETSDVFVGTAPSVILNTLSQLRFTRHANSLYYEVTEPLDSNSAFSATQFNSDCSVSLLENGNTKYLIVANDSDTQQQFIIDGVDLTMDSAIIRRYSASGELLNTRSLSRSDVRHTLQAGEFIVIEISSEL